MKDTMIICGFPGVGKTHMFNNVKDLVVLDSDSSEFSWASEGVRHPEFPNNYIEHIKSKIGTVDIIFVSTHKEVREALKQNNLRYITLVPLPELKEEYLERYKERNSPQCFINLMDGQWTNFISGIIEDEELVSIHWMLSGQYVSDKIDDLIHLW